MRGKLLTGAMVTIGVLAVAGGVGAKITDFGKPKKTSSGADPTALVIADLNRDGRKDAVTSQFNPGELSVLKGRGRRGMKRIAALPTPLQPDEMVAARVDGDKHFDLVVGTLNDAILIYLGQKGFGFMDPIMVPSAGWPRKLALADFNNDGLVDIAAGRQQSDDSVVHLQLGGGAFGGPTPVMGHAVALGAADLDADGNNDLAGYVFSLGQLVILMGNGDGTFGPGPSIPIAEGQIERILPVDVDRNGTLDLVLLRNAGEPPGKNDVLVLRGRGDGSFKPARSYRIGAQAVTNIGDRPADLVLARLNGDRHLDAAVTIEHSQAGHQNKVAILRGRPGGKFAPPRFIAGGPTPERIGAYRANGDKLRDLLIAGTRPGDPGDFFDPGDGIARVRIKR